MGQKILLVDDSVNLTEALKKRFEFEIEGVSVFIAHDGKEGLAIAQKEIPSVVILDINMPEMDGDAVLHELKSVEATRDIPVIILTSHGPEERSRFLAAGAFDYITSPFATDTLVGKVKTLMGFTG